MGPMQRLRKRSLSLLSLAGLCSLAPLYWLITSPNSKGDENILLRMLTLIVILAAPGGFFGLAVSTYFVFYEGFWKPARVLAFIVFCEVAFWASVIGALPLMLLFGGDLPGPFKGTMSLSSPYLFGAGYVGAFIVMLAGRFAFSEAPLEHAVLVRALLLSLAGGAAALLGGLADPAVADAVRSHEWEGVTPLFCWPPVVALLLGLFLNQIEARSEEEDSQTVE